MEKTPLVSVCCITYNHAPYISQCVDGFLMQKTSFPYEIIINDDCSSDGTTEILKEYAEKYPDLIQLILHDENQYSKGIRRILATFVYPLVKGKYIAICEGDDYWTDPNKLQKQVDFLESHPDYGLVHANANSFFQETKKMVIAKPVENYKEKGFNDIIWRNPVITLTALYRREAMEGYTDLLRGINFGIGDLPVWLYISHRYKVHFLNETVGVYRHVSGSASHGKTYEKRKKYLDDIFQVVTFFAEKYGVENFEKLENRYHINLFNEAFAYKRKDDAISEYNKISTKNFRIYVKRFLLLFVSTFGSL